MQDNRLNASRARSGYQINSLGLPKVDKFSKSKVYKKECTIRGSPNWKRVLNELINILLTFLKNIIEKNSESFADKKLFGWKVAQKREDRIDTALFCRDIWHNLLCFNPVPKPI